MEHDNPKDSGWIWEDREEYQTIQDNTEDYGITQEDIDK